MVTHSNSARLEMGILEHDQGRQALPGRSERRDNDPSWRDPHGWASPGHTGRDAARHTPWVTHSQYGLNRAWKHHSEWVSPTKPGTTTKG